MEEKRRQIKKVPLKYSDKEMNKSGEAQRERKKRKKKTEKEKEKQLAGKLY